MIHPNTVTHAPVTCFDLWMNKVDAWLRKTVGLVNSDLADAPYRYWFDTGLGPRKAAALAVRINKGDDGC